MKSTIEGPWPDGVTPTLLVFCTLPRFGPPQCPASKTNIQRVQALRKALRKATASMIKHFALIQVRHALRTRNGPDVSDILSATVFSPVVFYRERTDRSRKMWKGPFTILYIDDGEVTLLMPTGPQKCLTSHVKPYGATQAEPHVGNLPLPSDEPVHNSQTNNPTSARTSQW